MGITAQFKGDLDGMFKELLLEIEEQIIETLNHVGEEAVKLAKLPHANDWTDQTGNLRSSIGYVVFKDGKPLKTFFEGKDEGVSEGKKLAAQVGENLTGYALVVVAGMNYAVHVESGGQKNRKPRDVLTSAEIYARKQIAQELADLVTNVKNAFE